MEHSSGLAHQQALEVLPWYVSGRLEPEEARWVETHLGDCPDCQREADGLTKMISLHQMATPQRPVNEARLRALLGRIEGYEAGRVTQTGDTRESPRSAWEAFKQRMQSWLNVRPVLLASVCTAAIVAAIGVPTLRAPVSTDAPFNVEGPAVDELKIRVRFAGAPERGEIERLVRSGYAGPFRIETVTDTQYVVSLKDKPAIDTVSGLLSSWRGAPNVADVQIDSGTSDVEN